MQIVFAQRFEPSNLSFRQMRLFLEINQSTVVSYHLSCPPIQIWAKLPNGDDDGEQLLLVSWIVDLRAGKFVGEVTYRL